MALIAAAWSLPISNEDSTTEASWEFDSSTKMTIEPLNIQLDFMILAILSGVFLMIIIGFAVAAFYCGCGYLACGVAINHYEQI